MERRFGVSAAAMCIGPLSTLTTKRARRMSQINSGMEVWLSRFSVLEGGRMREALRPASTTGSGSAWQSAWASLTESDLPAPREKGWKRMNGSLSENAAGLFPGGSVQSRGPVMSAPAAAASFK